MGVAGLLDALPVLAEGSEVVPVDDDDFLESVGQHPGGKESADARSDDDGAVPSPVVHLI